MDFTPARSVGLDDHMVFKYYHLFLYTLFSLHILTIYQAGGMESTARTYVAPSFEIRFLYYNAIYQLNFLNTQQQVSG
jgi:hypothetical protein